MRWVSRGDVKAPSSNCMDRVLFLGSCPQTPNVLREEEENLPPFVFIGIPPGMDNFGDVSPAHSPPQKDEPLAAVLVECMTCAPWLQVIRPRTVHWTSDPSLETLNWVSKTVGAFPDGLWKREHVNWKTRAQKMQKRLQKEGNGADPRERQEKRPSVLERRLRGVVSTR